MGKMKTSDKVIESPGYISRWTRQPWQTHFCSVFFIFLCWMKTRPRIDLNGQVLKGDGKFSESFTFIDRKGLSSCLFEPALNQRLKQRKSAFWGPPRWKGPAPAFSLFWFFLPRCTQIDKPFPILWTTKSSVGEVVQFEFLKTVQSALKFDEFCYLHSMVVRNVLTMLSLGNSLKLWERWNFVGKSNTI